jgi:hypothetical protein
VEAGVATRVFSVSLGGFDFHADEKAAQERLLGELDSAVAGFAARMASTERGRKVVVMVYSEFGRRVRANASDGTDHGTASNVLVLGAPVNGGRFVGEQPSLTDLDDGDLKASMDFRDIYATMLADVLGADPADPRRLLGPRPRTAGHLDSGWRMRLHRQVLPLGDLRAREAGGDPGTRRWLAGEAARRPVRHLDTGVIVPGRAVERPGTVRHIVTDAAKRPDLEAIVNGLEAARSA